MRAIGISREAAPPSVPDQQMREKRPLLARNDFHKVALDFYRIGFYREPEPLGQSRDVRVHSNSDVDAERVPEDHVRGFASYAAEVNQLLHRFWNLAAVLFNERAAARLNIFRFVAIKSGGFDVLLQFGKIRIREILGGTIFFEQIRRDNIHAFVGALSGQDSRDQQFERIRKIQFAMRVGISFAQRGDNFFNTRRFCFKRLSWHDARIIGWKRFEQKRTKKTKRRDAPRHLF
jgi:hypothetical protein